MLAASYRLRAVKQAEETRQTLATLSRTRLVLRYSDFVQASQRKGGNIPFWNHGTVAGLGANFLFGLRAFPVR